MTHAPVCMIVQVVAQEGSPWPSREPSPQRCPAACSPPSSTAWLLSSWAARQLGAAPEDAAALAILTHAGMVGAGIAVGAVSAIARRRTFVELLRRRREVAHLADRPEAEEQAGSGGGPGLPRGQGEGV